MAYFLKASMGFVEAALRAGIMPEMIPMVRRIRIVATPTAGLICGIPTYSWIFSIGIALRIRAAKRKPRLPPIKTIASDSAKNCQRMCRRFAPTASLMPISLVRSSTTTSMMEATPTPPTNRVKEPIRPRKILKAKKKIEKDFSNSVQSQTKRASLSSGEKPALFPRYSRTVRMRDLEAARFSGWKMRLPIYLSPKSAE